MPKDYKRVLLEQLKETRKVKAAAKRNGGNGKNGRSRKTATVKAKKAARG
jgi:hypothetical protein